MEGMLSPADIAVLSGNTSGNRNGGNSGFGDGNSAWWVIILIVLLGWNRNGFGGNQGGGNSDGGQGANYYYGGFGAPNIYGKLDGITYGISDATFALNNSITNGFANVQSALCQGFSGVNNAITVNGYETRLATQGLSRQLADCCCDIRSGIQQGITQGVMNTNSIQSQIASCCCDLEKANMLSRFDAQTYNCNTLQAIDKLGDRIIDHLTQDKIATLQSENQALRFQASQTAQNAFITANQDAQTAELIRRLGADYPQAAYLVNAPTPVNFPTNCCGQVQFSNNNGCGCGCGCNNY